MNGPWAPPNPAHAFKQKVFVPLPFLGKHFRILRSIQSPHGELPKHVSERFTHLIIAEYDGKTATFSIIPSQDLWLLSRSLARQVFKDGQVDVGSVTDRLRRKRMYLADRCGHPMATVFKRISLFAAVDRCKYNFELFLSFLKA